MVTLVLILKFWGGLLLLFAMGWLFGQILRFDKHIKN